MSLSRAQALLQEAKDELLAFCDEYPKRVDSTIARVLDFTGSAADQLDAEFYIEREAEGEEDE